MKKIKLTICLLLVLPVLLLLTTCSKTDTNDPTKMYGDVMFWTNVNNNHSSIAITFRNTTRFITIAYADQPNCGANGCVTFEDIPIGTYSYYATDNIGYWEGEVTIYRNKCSKMLLCSDLKDIQCNNPSTCSYRIDFHKQ